MRPPSPTAKGILPMLLAVSCSGIQPRPEITTVIATASAETLSAHLHALTAIGPRRAGDADAQAATLSYLEQAVAALGITTERESFTLTPSATVSLQLDDGSEVSPEGSYFSATIRQGRVVHGFASTHGLLGRYDSYTLLSAPRAAVEQVNLMATIPGTEHPERVLEISAHHDTVPFTVGADDNTSGVAVLLEVARLLQQEPPPCTVRLCFFAAEEIGLKGSQEHVRRMQESGEISQVFGLINLDAVGIYRDEPDSQQSPARIPFVVWPPRTGNFLTLIGANGSASLAGLIEGCGEIYAPGLPLYSLARLGGFLPDARRSDHAPYWDADIPAVFLTDTGEFRSDSYHRPSDAPDGVDMPRLREVAVLVAAAALEACHREAAR